MRVLNGAIDKIDLEPLMRQYKGDGTSSYSKTYEDATFFRMKEDWSRKNLAETSVQYSVGDRRTARGRLQFTSASGRYDLPDFPSGRIVGQPEAFR